MERIIIDTDPGIDDAHAIMMASAYHGVQIEALTVVGGNVGLDKTVANSCIILDLLGEDVPVYAGCSSPFIPGADDAAHVHGDNGLGNVVFAPSPRVVEQEHASAALVRMASAAPGELTLVAIGPLTNLAVALKLDPDLPTKFKRLVIMGGAINAHGNTTHFSSEFNIYTDPEAAHIVFADWPEFTLVSWETTMAHGLPLALVDHWRAIDSPRARFFSQITGTLADYVTVKMGRPELYGADGLAMAVALEPEIVQKVEKHYVVVELAGKITRGQTTVDWTDRSGKPKNAHIVQQVDQARFLEMMEIALI